MKQTTKRRSTTLALICAMLLPACTAFAAAPEAQTDETVYVNLDAYGALADMRIVKGVSLNGQTAFTDHGSYAEVHNMTSFDVPDLREDTVSWSLNAPEKQRFYYECIPADHNALQLPWTFDVSYRLDGVPVRAEDCAGASGLIEITVHAIPNTNADPYYQNNMTLLAATAIDMNETKSIDAPGAQIQSLGSYKMVVFLGLPGEENTFTIRIGSDCFETMGVFLTMAPATLSQLDQITDLRNARDKLQGAGDDVYAGLSSLLDTTTDMKSGLAAMQAGVAALDEARRQLVAARGTLDPDTEAALEALTASADHMDSMLPELTRSQETLQSLNTTTNSILGTLADTRDDLAAYQKSLKTLESDLTSLSEAIDALETAGYTDDGLDYLLTQTKKALSNFSSSADALRNDLSRLGEQLAALLALTGTTGDPLLDALLQSGALSGLASDLDRMLSAVSALSDTASSTASLIDDYRKTLEDHSGTLPQLTSTLAALAAQGQGTLKSLDQMLAEIPNLQVALDTGTTDLQSLLQKSGEALTNAKTALDTMRQTLADTRQTLLDVRGNADAGASQSVSGALDMMQRALGANDTNRSLQAATDSIHSTVQGEFDDLESDSNLLSLDNTLALRSFTSAENPSPASLQFILRTAEISTDDVKEAVQDEEAAQDEGVLRRILNIFHKLYEAVTGVFASEG